jgi:acyl transferase domain-containing protein/surfactin synthase thioesterase subunit
VRPEEVDVAEAHGTGTALGDPIEAQALLKTYGRFHTEERPLWLGSVKSNLGHNAAAAGVTGVIKMVLALQHGMMPKTLHAEQPTRHVDWDSGYVRLLAEARVWQRDGHPRRAAVSAFGISGTNAHLILEEAALDTAAASEPERTAEVAMPVPLLVSAPDAAALKAQAARLSRHLQQHPQQPLQDVAWTLVKHRSLHGHRGAVLAASHQEAASALLALSEGHHSNKVLAGVAQPGAGVVFVFPGQGSQWPGMGRGLYAEVPAFAAAIDQCDEALRPHTDWSLREVLLAADATQAAAFGRVDILQPVLFAMAIALSRVWQAYGIAPAAVVGHSQGEIAAACIAGALSLEDAARVVAVRSKLLRAYTGHGSMATIALPVAEVINRLDGYADDISVAVVNSASSTVVAGAQETVRRFVQQANAEGIFAREIAVDYASHSADVEPVLPALRADLAGLAARPLAVPMFSTLLAGQPLQGPELDGDYWARNLREPVRLDLAVAELSQRGHTLFLEISAHPQLLVPLSEQLGPHGAAIESLRRGQGSLEQLLHGAAMLAVHGYEPDWLALLGRRGRLVDLPTYGFQRQPYWQEAMPLLAGKALPAEKDFWSAVERGDAAELARSLAVEDAASQDALSLLLPKLASWRVLAKREDQGAAATSERPGGPAASLADLEGLPEAERRDHLTDLLRREIARILLVPVANLDVNQRLTHLGLDSILAMAIKRRIEVALGVQLSAASLLRGATVAQLAQELSALPILAPGVGASEGPPLVAAHVRPASLQSPLPAAHTVDGIRPAPGIGQPAAVAPEDAGPWVPIKYHPQAEMHLFCLPYAGGGPATFRKWAAQLPERINASVLQLPGRGGRLLETPYTSMEELVAAVLPSLVGSLGHRVPFALFGYSLGALVAFELAGQLVRRHGRCPEHLFAGGARAPWWHTEEQHELDILQFSPMAGLPEYELPDRELLDYLAGVALAGGSAALRDAELQQLLLPAVRADFRVFRSYIYQEQPPLPVPITAIAGRADPVVNALQLTGWKKHTTARCDVRFLSGDHGIVETQQAALVEFVASILRKDAVDSAAG